MVHSRRPHGIEFSPDGAAVTFNPRMPLRGWGWFLIVSFVLVAPFWVGGMVVIVRYPEKNDQAMLFVMAGLLVFVAIVFLLPGLYLVTRWCATHLDSRGVTTERGCCFFRRKQRRALSEFGGLLRSTCSIDDLNAGSIAGVLVGGVLGAALGAPTVASDGVLLHVLQLKHGRRRSLDVLLICDPKLSIVNDLMSRLADQFSLSILHPAAAGFAARRPDELEQSIVDRSAQERSPAPQPDFTEVRPPGRFAGESPDPLFVPPPAGVSRREAALPQPRPGVMIRKNGSSETITFSAGNRAVAVVMFALGSVFLAIAGFALSVESPEDGPSPLVLAVAPFLIGAFFVAFGMVIWRARCRMTLTLSGVTMRGAGVAASSAYVPWREIRHAAAAKRGGWGQWALLLATDSRDHWLAVGCRADVLRWLSKAILAKAAEVAQTGAVDPVGPFQLFDT